MTMTSPAPHALQRLGVVPTTLTARERTALDDDGYVVFPAVLDAATVSRLRTRLEEIEVEEDAWAVRSERDPGAVRVDDINHKGDVFDVVWTHPKVLAAAYHLLGDLRLSSVTARAARPGEGHQVLHVDYWGPFDRPSPACNSSWMLDDFTLANGATRVVPGSHRWGRKPDEVLDDPRDPHPAQVHVEGPAGSLAVFHGYLWHGGSLNTTSAPRRGIFSVFAQRSVDRQNDQAARADAADIARLSNAARYVLDV